MKWLGSMGYNRPIYKWVISGFFNALTKLLLISTSKDFFWVEQNEKHQDITNSRIFIDAQHFNPNIF